MSFMSSLKGYASQGYAYAAKGFNAGSRHLGVGGMAAATGAGAGALYGATLGRDPGQSRLAGAAWGAAGGAALGAGARYSKAFWTGSGGTTSWNAVRSLPTVPNRQRVSRMLAERGIGAVRAAGQADFAALGRLAGGSNGLIGRTITKGYGKIKGLFV